MKNLDVAVVGNVGIDTNVYLGTAAIDFEVEANFTENLDCVGQAGGYVARGYARLGKRTAFIGHVGEDSGGRLVREAFAWDRIDTRALGTDPTGTSRSVNFMYPDGRRKNFYDGKAHMSLEPDLEVCRSVLTQARLAHFNIPNWARRLLPMAREMDLVLACDLQDVVDPQDIYRLDFVEAADILFFSAANHGDPTPLLQAFLEGARFKSRHGGRIVVCGMGAKGCALATPEGIRFFPPINLPGAVVDTNGAGDGLAVGFLAARVLEGRSLEDSILRGQIVARHTCTLKSDTSRLIRPAALERHFRRLRQAPGK